MTEWRSAADVGRDVAAVGHLTPRSPLWLAGFLVLGVLLPLALVVSTGEELLMSAALAVLVLVLLHSAAGLAGALASSEARLVEFLFWTFGYVWLGLAGCLQVATRQFPWPGGLSPVTEFQAALLVEIGLLAFSLGSWASRHWEYRILRARAGKRVPAAFSPVRVLVLAVVSVAVTVVMVPRLGGLEAYFSSRVEASEAAGAATGSSEPGPLYALVRWGVSIPAFWALASLLFSQFPKPMRNYRNALFPLVLCANVVVNNPVSQPRFWFGTMVLGLAFASRWMASRVRFRVGLMAVLLLLLVVFPYADYFRSSDADRAPRVESVVTTMSSELRTNGDYDAFQQVGNGLAFVSSMGHQPEMSATPAFFWVPRSIWSEKADPTGQLIAEFTGQSFSNLSAPLWIEMYLWGGWVVVALVFGTWGAVTSRLDAFWSRWQGHPQVVWVTLISTLAFFQLFALRGALLPSMGPLVLMVATPLLLISRTGSAVPMTHQERGGR